MNTDSARLRCFDDTAALTGLLFSAAIPLAALFVAASSGCTTTPAKIHADSNSRLAITSDSVGLTCTRPAREFTMILPMSRSAAARQEANFAAKDTLHSEAFYIAPASYLIGSAIGTMLGVSESDLNRAIPSVQAAAADQQVDAWVARELADHFADLRSIQLHPLENGLPVEPPATTSRFHGYSDGRIEWSTARPAHPLAGRNVDTLVGFRVAYHGFQDRTALTGQWSTGDGDNYNPSLAFVLTVDVVAIRVSDWAPVGGFVATYESTPRKFLEWAADNAQPLRREMEAGLQEISRQFAIKLIPETAPDHDSPSIVASR